MCVALFPDHDFPREARRDAIKEECNRSTNRSLLSIIFFSAQTKHLFSCARARKLRSASVSCSQNRS
jgi:hypothetical protein